MTGYSILIVPEQARWVRWIFEKYAEGYSPRKIAAALNVRGIPSPGSVWKRETRRKDGKWLASTIYGDPERWSGILHNELYHGVRVWNRSRRDVDPRSERKVFRRRAAEEFVRVEVEHLRIVDDELWNRVRSREAWVRERYGARGKAGLARGKTTKRELATFARRGFRLGTYPLSGLLKCHACGASLVVSGTNHMYVCASHTNGGKAACANGDRIRRVDLEGKLFAGFAAELGSPKYEEMFEIECRRLLAAAGNLTPGGSARVKELEAKVTNLTDAIADGALKSSLAIAKKLADLEAALARAKAVVVPANVTRVLPRAFERYRKLVRDLPATAARDPVAGREPYAR